MKNLCVWEHNGNDTLLYSATLVGAYTRGATLAEAQAKMPGEVSAYLRWRGLPDGQPEITLAQEAACQLTVRDADSDIIFDSEQLPLSSAEYAELKQLALDSARDFLALYNAVPDKDKSALTPRETFYGTVPRTAEEMYQHTKSVNRYYFSEIGVDADNDGTIFDCRKRGFALLEQQPDFLTQPPRTGSYDEVWSLRKVLRRFVWHDRIHARAMYRMALKTFGEHSVPDVFRFEA